VTVGDPSFSSSSFSISRKLDYRFCAFFCEDVDARYVDEEGEKNEDDVADILDTSICNKYHMIITRINHVSCNGMMRLCWMDICTLSDDVSLFSLRLLFGSDFLSSSPKVCGRTKK
jgi:hypothetical protein